MTINEQEFAPDSIYLPILVKIGTKEGDIIYDNLIKLHTDKIIRDQLDVQKKELFKIRQHGKQFLPPAIRWCIGFFNRVFVL